MELPLVATNAVRFARPEDALAHKLLQAIGRGATADGVLGHTGRDGCERRFASGRCADVKVSHPDRRHG
jgi:hypothetical protein